VFGSYQCTYYEERRGGTHALSRGQVCSLFRQYNCRQLLNGTQSYEIKQGIISDLEKQVDGLNFEKTFLLTTTMIFLVIALAEAIIIYRKKNR